MEFCPECGALLVPKKKGEKTLLTCRKCGFKKEVQDKLLDYRIVYRIPHSEKERLAIIEGPLRKKVSEEEREAFEDFYGTGETEESDTETEGED